MPMVHKKNRQELLQRVTLGWRAVLRAQQDLTPRSGQRGVHDEALAAAVVKAALGSPEDLSAREELERAARDYARLPRRRRFDARAMHRELSMLRCAVWVSLRECFPSGAARVSFLKRLDRTIMATLRATVRGRPPEAEASERGSPAGRMVPERRTVREIRF